MTYAQIFAAYYTIYRTQADVPASTDDEYTIGLQLANEAINRWAHYDGTYWKELFTTAQTNSTGGTVTITTSTKTYAAPTAFREAGGFVKVLDANNNELQRYPIIEPQEAQFMGDSDEYAYFTKAVTGIFTLHINPAPTSSLNGLNMDYVYYKTPTEMSTGTSTTEMSNPYFIVHRMLAMRFRGSRNPYYQSAMRDSEDMLKIMQIENNSGSWANPPIINDNSYAVWGT